MFTRRALATSGTVFLLLFAVLAALPVAAREISFDQRVEYQRAIEEVFWRHRIWPAQNLAAKPSFSEVVPSSAIQAKVEVYLKKSSALEELRRPITTRQLQAEMNRMARDTRDGAVLRELYRALGDDPFVIAETLARQTLAERRIREVHREATGAANAMKFDAWWAELSPSLGVRPTTTGGPYVPAVVEQEGCTADSWSETYVGAPDARSGHTAVWTGSEMIVWGGWADWGLDTGGRYSPATDTWSFTSRGPNTPEAREHHTAVWTGSEMIVWGGNSPGAQDTGARYDPLTDTWTATSTGPNLPTGRYWHTAVWTGSEMIVWGGAGNNSALFFDGGRYDPLTDTWTPTSTGANVPAARERHTAVWTGSEMIVWGGSGDAARARFDTGGRYDPSTDTWTPTSTEPGVPSARTFHTAVWTGGQMIVWGGLGPSYVDSGGRYDPATDTWTPTSTSANVAGARSRHTAVWTGNEMIVWGGWSDRALDTGGRYNPSTDTWNVTSTDPGVPERRYAHTAVWTGSEMIVWGSGLHTGGRYDPATDSWTAVSTGGYFPDERSSHTAVWTGSEMIVWGGQTEEYNGDYFDTGGRYTPATDSWTPTSTAAGVPSPRRRHTAVWTGTEMIVWGGDADGWWANTGGRYDPLTDSWVTTSTAAAVPDGRQYHSAVWTGTEMIVWGGLGNPNYTTASLRSGGRYEPTTNSWIATPLSGAPSSRHNHSAVWTGTEMIVWGGEWFDDWGEPWNYYSGGRFDPLAGTWAPTSTGVNVPEARFLHTAVWTGREMIVWGGSSGVTYQIFQNGGRYEPSTDTWSVTSTGQNVAEPRSKHTAVWTGAEMIVWGGYRPYPADVNILFTGGRYDPAADAWVGTSTGDALPIGRSSHTAVWTGTQMIVWAGHPITSTGGLYCVDECASPGLYYQDGDGDGFGTSTVSVFACVQPVGYVLVSGDCNDACPTCFPGATEICDGLDNSCNGAIDDLPPPDGIAHLDLRKTATAAEIFWTPVPGSDAYDIVRGNLAMLLVEAGDYGEAVDLCLGNDVAGGVLEDEEDPESGASFFYLVRPSNCEVAGSYESLGPAQVGERDPRIELSAAACP